MWEIFIEPAKTFIKGGVESFKKSDEIKNLTIAIQSRIKREIRFNSAILEEVNKKERESDKLKNSDEIRYALIKSMKTKAFDDVNNGAIPVYLFFGLDLEKDKWPNWKNKDNYLKYCQSDKTQLHLLERTYHRIYLAKTFAECGKMQGDLEYTRFLLASLNSSITSHNIDS